MLINYLSPPPPFPHYLCQKSHFVLCRCTSLICFIFAVDIVLVQLKWNLL